MFKSKTDMLTANKPSEDNIVIPESAISPPKQPPMSMSQVSHEATSPADLERLRDILFGDQSRNTDKRLGDLETRLETVRRELLDALHERTNSYAESSATQLAETRQSLTEQLNQQATEQNSQLRAAQQTFEDRFDTQSSSQTSQLRTIQRELGDRVEAVNDNQSEQLRVAQREFNQRLEELTNSFLSQLRATQKELGERIDQLSASHSERIRNLQVETRQRDDSLRQELLAMAHSLDDRKTSRSELSQMLVELGQRLNSDK